MEGQKLLWIVFSVVLFVVVVLASALYFLRPQGAEPAVAGAAAVAGAFDTYEYVRGVSPVLPVEEPQGQGAMPEVVVVGEEAPTVALAVPVAPPVVSPAAPAVSPAPKPAEATRQRTAPAAAPRTAAPTRQAPRPATAAPGRVYWIQTASFRSRTGAEVMAESLGDKGIPGRLQVSDVDGRPYYRVRVGPYTSRQEAEKFLAWIKGVKGLEQSYISVVAR